MNTTVWEHNLPDSASVGSFELDGCSVAYVTYFSSVNQRISNMCRDNSFVFIDNNNIPTSSLLRDSLHLLEVGKRILANNFIDNLNNSLRIRQMHRPPP